MSDNWVWDVVEENLDALMSGEASIADLMRLLVLMSGKGIASPGNFVISDLRLLLNEPTIEKRLYMAIESCGLASRAHSKHAITVPLVTGRDAETGEFMYERTEVELHIVGLTIVSAQPGGEAVWAFDPETLELLHVPTYNEAKRRKSACARLSVIEGGKL